MLMEEISLCRKIFINHWSWEAHYKISRLEMSFMRNYATSSIYPFLQWGNGKSYECNCAFCLWFQLDTFHTSLINLPPNLVTIEKRCINTTNIVVSQLMDSWISNKLKKNQINTPLYFLRYCIPAWLKSEIETLSMFKLWHNLQYIHSHNFEREREPFFCPLDQYWQFNWLTFWMSLFSGELMKIH